MSSDSTFASFKRLVTPEAGVITQELLSTLEVNKWRALSAWGRNMAVDDPQIDDWCSENNISVLSNADRTFIQNAYAEYTIGEIFSASNSMKALQEHARSVVHEEKTIVVTGGPKEGEYEVSYCGMPRFVPPEEDDYDIVGLAALTTSFLKIEEQEFRSTMPDQGTSTIARMSMIDSWFSAPQIPNYVGEMTKTLVETKHPRVEAALREPKRSVKGIQMFDLMYDVYRSLNTTRKGKKTLVFLHGIHWYTILNPAYRMESLKGQFSHVNIRENDEVIRVPLARGPLYFPLQKPRDFTLAGAMICLSNSRAFRGENDKNGSFISSNYLRGGFYRKDARHLMEVISCMLWVVKFLKTRVLVKPVSVGHIPELVRMMEKFGENTNYEFLLDTHQIQKVSSSYHDKCVVRPTGDSQSFVYLDVFGSGDPNKTTLSEIRAVHNAEWETYLSNVSKLGVTRVITIRKVMSEYPYTNGLPRTIEIRPTVSTTATVLSTKFEVDQKNFHELFVFKKFSTHAFDCIVTTEKDFAWCGSVDGEAVVSVPATRLSFAAVCEHSICDNIARNSQILIKKQYFHPIINLIKFRNLSDVTLDEYDLNPKPEGLEPLEDEEFVDEEDEEEEEYAYDEDDYEEEEEEEDERPPKRNAVEKALEPERMAASAALLRNAQMRSNNDEGKEKAKEREEIERLKQVEEKRKLLFNEQKLVSRKKKKVPAKKKVQEEKNDVDHGTALDEDFGDDEQLPIFKD